MNVGFWFTDDEYTNAICPAAGAMDVGGLKTALRSDNVLLRPYFKGNPDPQSVVDTILRMDAQAQSATDPPQNIFYQIGNEPNLDHEGWKGGLPAYVKFFKAVRVRLPTHFKLAWAGMSPGVKGWEKWYEAATDCDAVVVHAYGQTLFQLTSVVNAVLEATPIDLIIGESNFGPGPDVDIDRDVWSDIWASFLDWVSLKPRILFTLYFGYTWHADTPIKTPVDAKGTKILMVTLVKAIMPDLFPNVPPLLPPDSPVPLPTPVAVHIGPKGRAWWVWYVANCGGPRGIIDTCRKTNANTVFIKGGDGPYSWSQITRELVDELTFAGIAVYVWHYTYLGHVKGNVHGDSWKWTTQDEVRAVEDMLTAAGPNCKGFVSDPEAETEGRAREAAAFCTGVRALLSNKFFGYAPLPVIDFHTKLPYTQFNSVCDAMMPQFYSRNLQGNPPWTQERIIEQWTRWADVWAKGGLPVPPLTPTGETYGLATNESIVEFENLAKQHEWPSWSYWSMEHAQREGHVQTLEAIARDEIQEQGEPQMGRIALTAKDKDQAEAIFHAMWLASERLNQIIGATQYGGVGQRTGYWAEQALKGNQDLIKEVLGLND